MSPGRIDPAVVRRHLLALDAAVQALRKRAGRPLEALIEDLEELWTVERGLQLCAQNALDLATHIAASSGRDVPDYATAIDRLSEIGILPASFAAGFRDVAGLRNVLVRGYLDVDVAILHDLLNRRLDDFAELAGHVSASLARESAP